MMNTLKINRMNDFYFKYLLGSEQRKHLTIQFLNDVLYENEEMQINIEVQVLRHSTGLYIFNCMKFLIHDESYRLLRACRPVENRIRSLLMTESSGV